MMMRHDDDYDEQDGVQKLQVSCFLIYMRKALQNS